MMNTFRNAEEALEYLLYNIRMSTYDKKFMLNLQTVKVLAREPITSNQHSLFTKVVQKYHKQLAQLGYDAIELSTLPWSLRVIPSTTEYTSASIKIEDDQLILYTPYKANFVKDFRSADLMKWDRDERKYVTPYGLRTLKLVMDIVCKHYSELNTCDSIKTILSELSEYETIKYWTPTLIRTGDRLYVAASNQSLDNAMSDMELNLLPSTISRITALGVDTTKLMTELFDKTPPELMIASSINPAWDLEKIGELGEILKQIETDYLVVTNSYSTYMNEGISEEIAKLNIPYSVHSEYKIHTSILKIVKNAEYKHPVFIRFGTHGSVHNLGKKFASKVIDMVDYTPIKLT